MCQRAFWGPGLFQGLYGLKGIIYIELLAYSRCFELKVNGALALSPGIRATSPLLSGNQGL